MVEKLVISLEKVVEGCQNQLTTTVCGGDCSDTMMKFRKVERICEM